MSSSAPKRQLVSEGKPLIYAAAKHPGGESGDILDGASNAGEAEERSRRERAEAFELGRQSTKQELRCEFDAAITRNRDQISHVLQQFVVERQSYYRRIEGEVVDLALAIARKVLHREAQVDPQVLAGIVRVTLEKLDSGTRVDLHVHPREAGDWRHYFSGQPQGIPAPDVYDDPAIAPGECRIETSLGSTKVGLESQLKEIETGLLDLLAERPGIVSGSSAGLRTSSTPPALIPTPATEPR